MSGISERRTYCPVVYIEDESGRRAPEMDWMAARYLDIADAQITASTFMVTESESGQPDAIAYRFYGDGQFGWLVCLFNGIVDPYTELVPGLKLLIPNLDEVLLYLNSKEEETTEAAIGRIGEI